MKATANPSPKLVLTAAKRLRAEVLKANSNEALSRRIPTFFAARDNLSLYTRLVRVQVASYHQSAAARSTQDPTQASTGAADSSKGVNDKTTGSTSSSSETSSSTHARPASSASSARDSEAWTFPRFSGDGSQKSKGEGSKEGEQGDASKESGPYTSEKPLPVYVVPSKLSYLSWAGWAIFSIVLIVIWTRAGSEGGSLGSIIGQTFSIAEPGDLTFDDVKGNEEAKEELYDVVEYLKDPTSFSNLGIKIPKGVLLTGPPGTGKTLLARVVASESGVPFISTSGSEFEEMLVGVGARRVRNLFQLAKKNAPCIIFVDEIDAIGGKRKEDYQSSRMSLNQLLVEMDGFSPNEGIVVIGATNMVDVLDPALIRPGRFDRKVHMELPDPRARKDILDLYLKKKKISPDVATGTLARATPGFSGADLENMVNWAAIISAKRKSDITMKILEEALFNVSMGRERKTLVLNDFTRKLCAYHEGGHALVSLYTPGSLDIRRATLVPRGGALGMVNYLTKEDSPLTTRQELLASMDTAMGGRAAELLIYGENHVTQGAGSDFQQATRIAQNMVSTLGMSPKIGPYVANEREFGISPETRHLIEQESRRLCQESFDRAYNILKTHEDELHLLAAALLKYESLTVDEIKRAIAGDPLTEKLHELEQTKILDLRLAEENAVARAKKREEVQEQRRRRKQEQGSPQDDSAGAKQERPQVKVTIDKKDN